MEGGLGSLNVFLLRHGEAGKRIIPMTKDSLRALTASGQEEVEGVGKSLAALGFKFDLIAASPLRRSKETALIVGKAFRKKPRQEDWDELKPEGSRQELYRRLEKVKPGSSVLLVGHEPYLSTTIGEITSKTAGSVDGFRVVLKKAGLAKITVTSFHPRISGELRWLLTPKQIRRMA
jgi:phosphohistidine phosphatase